MFLTDCLFDQLIMISWYSAVFTAHHDIALTAQTAHVIRITKITDNVLYRIMFAFFAFLHMLAIPALCLKNRITLDVLHWQH